MDARPQLAGLASSPAPPLADRLGQALDELWSHYLLVVDDRLKDDIRQLLAETEVLTLEGPAAELRAALDELWAHYLLVVDDQLKQRVRDALGRWQGRPEPGLEA